MSRDLSGLIESAQIAGEMFVQLAAGSGLSHRSSSRGAPGLPTYAYHPILFAFIDFHEAGGMRVDVNEVLVLAEPDRRGGGGEERGNLPGAAGAAAIRSSWPCLGWIARVPSSIAETSSLWLRSCRARPFRPLRESSARGRFFRRGRALVGRRELVMIGPLVPPTLRLTAAPPCDRDRGRRRGGRVAGPCRGGGGGSPGGLSGRIGEGSSDPA